MPQKKYLFLYFDFYWTIAYVNTYAYTTASIWRADNDLVEYRFSKDFLGIISYYPKNPYRQKALIK